MKHVVQFEIEIGDEKSSKVIKALKVLLKCLKWKVSELTLDPPKPDPFEEFKKAIPKPPWRPETYPNPYPPKNPPPPYEPWIPAPAPRPPERDPNRPYYWMADDNILRATFTC